jgi:hypothetical protein
MNAPPITQTSMKMVDEGNVVRLHKIHLGDSTIANHSQFTRDRWNTIPTG